MGKAIIGKHPKTGLVITELTSEKGNKYGKFMVQSTEMVVQDNGFLGIQSRAAFITVGEDQLEAAKAGLKAGDKVPFAGRIQRIESRTPQYEGHNPKVIPGEGDEEDKEYLLDGAPVYFQDLWNSDENSQDILLTSNVGETVVEGEDDSAEAGA